jgi:hypothetical protein
VPALFMCMLVVSRLTISCVQRPVAIGIDTYRATVPIDAIVMLGLSGIKTNALVSADLLATQMTMNETVFYR